MPAGNETGPVQVAYAVGRAVGPAVVRNRWRRRLRVLAAELAGELPPGMYLIGVRPDVTELSFEQLRERVSEAMRTASGRAR